MFNEEWRYSYYVTLAGWEIIFYYNRKTFIDALVMNEDVDEYERLSYEMYMGVSENMKWRSGYRKT